MAFEPQDPSFRRHPNRAIGERVHASFGRQRVMRTLGIQIVRLERSYLVIWYLAAAFLIAAGWRMSG
jgi:hypothetical protein